MANEGSDPPRLNGWERDVAEAADDMIVAGVAQLGEDREDVTVSIVPYQNRPLLPTTPKQKRRFWEQLDKLMDFAFREEPGVVRHDREDAEQGPLMDAACILCKGQCCLNGGPNNAFLEVEDIQRFRIRNPGATREDIKAAYEALMPEETCVMSCVFHGIYGCTLPREMRSQLCNSFVCRGQNLLAQGAAAGDEAAVLLAAPQNKAVAAATFDAKHGYRAVNREADDGR
ncbi:MAG: hypothetical protein AAFP68_14830 [Pseudomonadota bacterium]